VESKWLIPRESIFLEKVIGQGEFGRVLKGLAKGIAGMNFIMYFVIIEYLFICI